MYYGRAASFGHILLLVFLVPIFSMTFLIFKHIQAIFETFSEQSKRSNKTIKEIRNFLSSLAEPRAPPVILIMGAHFSKTLTIVRSIKSVLPGKKSRIILADTQNYAWVGARFSRYCDAFEVLQVRDVSQKEEYIKEMVRIGRKHKITGFLPVSVPRSATPDSLACEELMSTLAAYSNFDRPYHVSAKMCEALDNKLIFCQYCEVLGVTAPKTVIVNSDEEAHQLNMELRSQYQSDHNQMILKNLSYDCLHRLDLFTLPTNSENLEIYLQKIRKEGNAISPTNPWTAQTKLTGREYSAACIIRNGALKLTTVCESSPSQLRFEHTEHVKICAWLEKFVSRMNERNNNVNENELNLNNCQLCFDFIEVGNNVYPIECNPRVHSQLSVFSCSDVGKYVLGAALLNIDLPKNILKEASKNKIMACKVLHFGDELFKSVFRLNNYKSETNKIDFSVFWDNDADLCLKDPVPFFMKLHFQLPILLLQNIWKKRPWKKLDFCIGKVVELNGE